MNNPINPDDDLESRIEKLERDMKQVKSTLGHIKLDTGDARESLDAIERRQVEMNKLLRGIAQAYPDHGERLDTLTRGQQETNQDIKAIHEVFVKDFHQLGSSLGEVNSTINERFDKNERAQAEQDKRMDTMDGKLDQILQLLQPKQP